VLIPTDTILGPQPPRSAYLESYRVLRSAVLALKDKEPFGTVLVTSPGEREGKTTVIINLGIMLALVEKPTIVVDADFYGAGVGSVLDIPEQAPGLTDLCQGRATLDEALIETEIDSLRLLAAGTDIDQGPELAVTGAMQEVVAQLRGQADFVLFDCTPVSGFGTALSLAGLVDTVFVVTLARRQVTDVQRCLESLKDRDATIGGVIVNDVLHSDSVVYRAYHRYYQ
jgi:succinoglycan biosynthesis transport protein ExoP